MFNQFSFFFIIKKNKKKAEFIKKEINKKNESKRTHHIRHLHNLSIIWI
jgi:hypothetical protein